MKFKVVLDCMLDGKSFAPHHLFEAHRPPQLHGLILLLPNVDLAPARNWFLSMGAVGPASDPGIADDFIADGIDIVINVGGGLSQLEEMVEFVGLKIKKVNATRSV